MFDSLNSFNIVGSPLLDRVVLAPRKEHIKKDWMSASYHKRIQKKWNKRYGLHEVLPFIQTADCFYTHPDNIEKLKKNFSES